MTVYRQIEEGDQTGLFASKSDFVCVADTPLLSLVAFAYFDKLNTSSTNTPLMRDTPLSAPQNTPLCAGIIQDAIKK